MSRPDQNWMDPRDIGQCPPGRGVARWVATVCLAGALLLLVVSLRQSIEIETLELDVDILQERNAILEERSEVMDDLLRLRQKLYELELTSRLPADPQAHSRPGDLPKDPGPTSEDEPWQVKPRNTRTDSPPRDLPE